MHLFKDSLNVIKLVKFEDQQSSAMRDKAKGLNKNKKSVLTTDSGNCVVHFAINWNTQKIKQQLGLKQSWH